MAAANPGALARPLVPVGTPVHLRTRGARGAVPPTRSRCASSSTRPGSSPGSRCSRPARSPSRSGPCWPCRSARCSTSWAPGRSPGRSRSSASSSRRHRSRPWSSSPVRPGTAVAADLGSRKIREELDALEVLGISVIHRLVVPRVLAMAVVACLLNGVTTAVGTMGGYAFNVGVQGGSPGAYVHSFTALAQLPDLYVGELKALVFGLLAGIVATYQGVNAKGGPAGVGNGVNQSVDRLVRAAVRGQRRADRRLLPARPAEGAVMSAARPSGATPRAPGRAPTRRLSDLGDQVSFYGRSLARHPAGTDAATAARCCASSPRSPSAAVRWSSSPAPSAS